MTNGANHSGTISNAGQIDTWTFTASAGDAIVLSMGEVTDIGGFTPWIRLLGPTATILGSVADVAVAQINVTAPDSGTYTVLAATNDVGHDATGSYLLTLAKSPGAFVVPVGDEGGPMTNGGNHAGVIHLGDLDMWSFTANAGDAIVLSLGELTDAGGFTPWIRLFAPNGAILGSVADVAVAQINVTATLSGTYTVVVATNDVGHDATGSYLLTLAKSPGAFVVPAGDEGGPLTNGANHTGAIQQGDLDLWSFAARAGDAIVLSLGELTDAGGFTPWIRLFAPNGAILGSVADVAVAQINVTATLTGTYTVVVATNDVGHDAIGSYRLTLARTPGAFVVPAGDEGGPMVTGFSHPGAIQQGDLDMWTFSATGGNTIALSMGEVLDNGGFTPWIRLFGPTGTVLGSVSGAAVAQINVTAPLSGTYTVVAATNDVGHEASGTYLLTVTGVISPPRPTLTGVAVGATTARLSWTAVVGATSYNVKRGTISGGETFLASTLGTTFINTGLTPGTAYYYVVAPVNASGEGALSNEVTVRPGAAGDFESDGRTDRTVFRPSAGVWYSALSGGGATATSWGESTDVDVPGDYDGDGKMDIAVWRPSNGTWYIIQSSDSAVRIAVWGVSGDIPLAGDVDGDGKADQVIYRPSAGAWYFNKSGGGTGFLGWGISTDQPLLADFDGDGKMDPTIFRPSNGFWYGYLSGGGVKVVGWGTAGDIPVPADYDGDGKGDIAVFRPGTGEWFVVNSSNGLATVVVWGVSGDIPVWGDFDGDGRNDFTVWRSGGAAAWFTQYATGGFAFVGWGTTGDRPIGRRPGS